MALKKDLQHELGMLIPNVYFRAEHYQGTKNGMVVTVRGYATQENADSWSNHVYFKAFDLTPDMSDTAENLIKQTYTYLKTLDEFKDAVDV